MTIAHIAGWAILALIFGGLYAGMVAAMTQAVGFRTAFIGVTAIVGGSVLFVVLVTVAASLLKS